ncbi:MAG: lamin tail domain-containing protein [Clostridia bacterium]|nr:lamin tail domain-containing protein [Clostridia bacterium]
MTFFVCAEGDVTCDSSTTVKSDIPDLIITESASNSADYKSVYTYLHKDFASEKAQALGNTAQAIEEFYQPALRKEGDSLSGYYVLVDNGDGSFTFEAAQGTADGKTQYYLMYDLNTYDLTEVCEYIEIYNAGTEDIDLYQYQIVCDNNANSDGTKPIFVDLKAGAVGSSAHGEYFQSVRNLTAFEEGVVYYLRDGATFKPLTVVKAPAAGTDYYTKNTDGTYTKAASLTEFANGVVYYTKSAEDVYSEVHNAPVPDFNYYIVKEEGYHAVNPDSAVLKPGQTAIIWNYWWRSWICGIDTEMFKAYYETRYHSNNGYYYDVNFDNTLLLAMDGNTGSTTRYLDNKVDGFELVQWGQCNYGIAPDNIVNKSSDVARYDEWVSWAFWGGFAGVDMSASMVRQTVVVGETKVTGFYTYDSVTGEYTKASAAAGTASADGLALGGMTYYNADISKSDKNYYSNKNDSKTTDYLYGIDASVPIKEGTAYTIWNSHLTPGLLSEAQVAVLPNHSEDKTVTTETPDIVITEVVGDNVGSDAYEFVEVVNTSGKAINMFDYTFAARNDSYVTFTNQFFNRFTPIIPGDVGNILAADASSVYYAQAPTNVEYESGWLQPGEVAVLWAYSSASYVINATFDSFRNYFDVDSDVKIFALDADNSTYSGRPYRQNIANNNNYLYGLFRNDKLMWNGDLYTSDPVLPCVTYTSGKTHATAYGYSILDCESFVIACATFAACENVSWGEDYGLQYVWDITEGTNNKLGAYLDMARFTRYSSHSDWAFTGSVVTEEWKASPGTLLESQKTDMTTNKGESRYVVYMQDFEGYGNVSGYDEVAALLGITGITDDTTLLEDHLNNVKLTERKTDFLKIKNGKLYVNNRGNSDDYMMLLSDDVMNTLRGQNFTIEYSMTYAAESTNGKNGYSGILYDFGATDGSLTYGAPIVRVSGYGYNAVYRNGELITIDDGENSENTLANKTVSGDAPLTLYERLTYNRDYIEVEDKTSLENTVVMAGRELIVRVDVSRTKGVTVTVNGEVVSKTYDVVESATFAEWSLFLEETLGYGLAMVTTPDISVAYDYITVYTDSLTTNADDMDIPSMYITEISVNSGNSNYYTADGVKTNLAWIEYIEITNGGTEPVKLSDYSIVYTVHTQNLFHEGNNLLWKSTALSSNASTRLSEWLGSGDNVAKLSYGSGETYRDLGDWCNPSENDAVLQPGESAVIFTINGNANIASYKNPDGVELNYVEAAKDWLQISDDVICIATCHENVQMTDYKVEEDGTLTKVEDSVRTVAFTHGNDSTGRVYGIGKTYYNGKEVDWGTIYTHDYRYIDSLVNLNLSLANFSGGYAIHFLYGVDNSVNYKVGTILGRRYSPIVTIYDSAGSVSSAGQYNVGLLLPGQIECFRNIRSLAEDGYQTGGGLVITEYIFDTNSLDLSSNLDCFEAMEITNTSAVPMDLYDYTIARSTQNSDRDGTVGAWSSYAKLRAGCPVAQYNAYYSQLKDISNPATCIVQPGETVVVWVYSPDAYNYVNGTGTNLTFEDFRTYYAQRGNELINAKDESGNYKVTVLMASGDKGNMVNYGSDGRAITIYGLAKTSNMHAGTGNFNSVVSYCINPIYSGYYDQAWVKTQLASGNSFKNDANDTVIKTATGNFTWEDALAEPVELEVGTTLSKICVKNDDGTYTFAEGTAQAGVQYYKLYYYKFTTTITPPADLSFNFVYGSSMTSGWNVGAIMDSVKASKVVNTNDSTSNDYCLDTTPFDQTPDTNTVTVLNQGMRTNTLGYLIEEQKGMIAALNFTYMGEMTETDEDGELHVIDVYFYDAVVGDLSNAVVKNNSAKVSASGDFTTVSFAAGVSSELYDKLTEMFGTEKLSFGIIIARADAAMEAGMLRTYLLDVAGVDYMVDNKDFYIGTSNGLKNFTSNNRHALDTGYYAVTYSAVGYLAFETDAFGTITLYADKAISCNAKQIAATAMMELVDTATKDAMVAADPSLKYYEISAGKWSRYTKEQIARFDAICAAAKQ